MPNNGTKQPTIAPADSKVSKVPGVKISVDVGKDVVVRIPGETQSYRGRVVGYDPYEYIIISVRLPARTSRTLADGGQIILKYLHRGTVYGFKTYSLGATRSPAPLVFVEYPNIIEKIELRRESRREVNIDGELYTQEGRHECLIVNLSTTGCKISARATARDPLAMTRVDDTMTVAFNLGPGEVFKMPLAVRNIERAKGIISLGAMFLDLSSDEEIAIGEHLEKVERLTR